MNSRVKFSNLFILLPCIYVILQKGWSNPNTIFLFFEYLLSIRKTVKKLIYALKS